ncbi:hypothetical protein FB451DRAFT_1173050 [Mycena latifolia]|nr:hypothetical protein FB451DRAFT_1173050 [Mycena latifolia]
MRNEEIQLEFRLFINSVARGDRESAKNKVEQEARDADNESEKLLIRGAKHSLSHTIKADLRPDGGRAVHREGSPGESDNGTGLNTARQLGGRGPGKQQGQLANKEHLQRSDRRVGSDEAVNITRASVVEGVWNAGRRTRRIERLAHILPHHMPTPKPGGALVRPLAYVHFTPPPKNSTRNGAWHLYSQVEPVENMAG